MKTISETPSLDSQAVLPVEPGFPSVRYFQIHFEHLHETIDDLRRQVEFANRQITELQQRLQAGVSLAEIGPESYGEKCKAPSAHLG